MIIGNYYCAISVSPEAKGREAKDITVEQQYFRRILSLAQAALNCSSCRQQDACLLSNPIM
jgi:hypothetical protein